MPTPPIAQRTKMCVSSAGRFARNDQTPLPGFEQDDYVRHAKFDDRQLAYLAQEFEYVRRGTIHGLIGRPGTPELVPIGLHRGRRPRGWGRQRDGFVMARPGRLTASFAVRRSGSWDLWLQGQFMARVAVAIDGRPLASVEGQLGGNSLVADTVGPFPLRLGRGVHRLSVTRGGLR